MQIKRAGLTNNPNLHLTALANAEDGGSESERGAGDLRARLVALLGLASDVDDDTLFASIRDLSARRETVASAAGQERNPDALNDGVMELAAELNREKARVAEERVQGVVDQAVRSGRLPPYLRDWGLSLCRSDPEAFEEFASKMVPIIGSSANGNGSHGLPRPRTPVLSTEEQLACRNLGITAEAFHRTVNADEHLYQER